MQRIFAVSPSVSRRDFARGALGIGGAALLGGCAQHRAERVLDATGRATSCPLPAAPTHALVQRASVQAPQTCRLTESNMEGPFFKSGAPQRNVLAPDGMRGTRLTFTGHLLSTDCAPLAGGLMEIWHADDRGGYDVDGFRLRGTVPIDDDGAFHISTIVPGHYLNGARYRPAHLHLKLHAPGHQSLTTQLYFEGDPYIEGDTILRESLIVPVERSTSGWAIERDLVLARG